MALDGAGFDVEQATVTALIGPNGAGKSTLFDIVAGSTRANRGSVEFQGRELANMSADKRARLGMVRTFQSTRVFGTLSVLDNVVLGAGNHLGESLLKRTFRPAATRHRETALRSEARDFLEVVGLAHMEASLAQTLSGGQRKLLELARALMAAPALLLLDEPAAGVNPTLANQIIDHVRSLTRTRELTCLLVEHDMQLVMSRSDHVIAMDRGAVVCDGPPAFVQADQRVINAYLGGTRPTTSAREGR